MTKNNIFLLLVASGILFCNVVKAESFMVMQFNDNVKIVLSPDKCEVAGYRAAAQRVSGEFLKGCWSGKEDIITIKWEGGDFSDFPLKAFNPEDI